MNMLNPYLWLGLAIALTSVFFAGDYHGRDVANEANRKAQAAADAAVSKADLKMNQSLATTSVAITQKAQEVTQNETVKTASNVGFIRSGAVQLRVPVTTCTAGSPATPTTPATEARAELLPEVSARIYQLGRDADQAVRERNQCIDSYNDARDQLAKLSASQ